MDRPDTAIAPAAYEQEKQAAENLRECLFQPEKSAGSSSLKGSSVSEHDKLLDGASQITFEGMAKFGFSRLDLDKESSAIADLFDYSKNNKLYADAVNEGTQRLSADLKSLSRNITDYNKLLQSVVDKIPEEPAATPSVYFSDFNKATGTWNRVSVKAYDDSGGPRTAYRIVQPGNTLSKIARDEKDALAPSQSTAEFMKFLQKINNIADPDKIVIGQAIRMRKV